MLCMVVAITYIYIAALYDYTAYIAIYPHELAICVSFSFCRLLNLPSSYTRRIVIAMTKYMHSYGTPHKKVYIS